MAERRCHVIGAGLAGLAAAVELTRRGVPVTIHESGPHAGGRCRSYFDKELGCRLDNGNHLLLSGNDNAMGYLAAIGASDSLTGPPTAAFPFVDLVTGERWTLAPERRGWIFDPGRRVPGSGALDYLAALRIFTAGRDVTVADCLGRPATLFHRLWRPFTVAVLNTQPEEASARLLGRVLALTLGRGGRACRPRVPRIGLSESLIDPALALLRAAGAELRHGERLRAIEFADGRAAALAFAGGMLSLDPADLVVLAVPAPLAADLVPNLVVPTEFRAIVNAHYRVVAPATAPLVLGLIGGTAEWLFVKPGVVSATVSAAERHVERPAEDLAAEIWSEVACAYGLGAAQLPAWRIVKERRATFAATPAQLRRRPRPVTAWRNLFLAGDWTDTGLPATIEGAVLSGRRAAALALGEG